MDNKLSKVLKLIGDLNKQELMTLNQAVVSLIKTQRDVDFRKASITFKIGDIVSFVDSNRIKTYGIVTKRNPKTVQVTTENNYYVNIPATYLTLEEKPSQKLLSLRREIVPSPEDINKVLKSEFKKDTFH